MDELAVRSACAWNSKIAKRRRPQELVIRHNQVMLIYILMEMPTPMHRRSAENLKLPAVSPPRVPVNFLISPICRCSVTK
jgi:hypothetical protein